MGLMLGFHLHSGKSPELTVIEPEGRGHSLNSLSQLRSQIVFGEIFGENGERVNKPHSINQIK